MYIYPYDRYTYILEAELLIFSVLLLVSVLSKETPDVFSRPSITFTALHMAIRFFFSRISGERKILALRIISIRKIGHVCCYYFRST